jgi:hypothetical protein
MSDKAASQKTRSPEGCDENGPAAALLLSHVSIQICSLVAPCRRPILIATPLHQSLTWCTRSRRIDRISPTIRNEPVTRIQPRPRANADARIMALRGCESSSAARSSSTAKRKAHQELMMTCPAAQSGTTPVIIVAPHFRIPTFWKAMAA